MQTISLRQPLQDVLEKLDQLIIEGEEIRSFHVVTFDHLYELRSKIEIWKEYTALVLENLFTSGQQEHDFRVHSEVSKRMSGTAGNFAEDEKRAILGAVTYLKTLQRILPIVGKTEAEQLQEVGSKQSGTEPEAEPVAALLHNVSTALANSYRQVRRDLQDATRLSYRGTANELREILREVLHRLAPDHAVMARDWFESQGGTRPTHQQRARYILEKKGAGSRVDDVVNRTLATVDEGLSALVRDMYSRVSVAAHTSQDFQEIKKQLRYFDALMHDLC